MAIVTIHSDFGAQGNKICHCFHFFSIYLPWSDRTAYHDLVFWTEFFFFFFHVRKVMCQCCNKVWGEAHITQKREHPIIMLMNYKRIEHWVLSQVFHSPLSPLSRGSLVPFHFLPLGWYNLHIWGYWYSPGNFDSCLCFIQPSILHYVLCK